jgi:hypothetical protein
MRSQRIALGSLAVLALVAGPAGAAGEEFAGPFPSWADVRRDYGARGDGKTDDTAAIRKALDDLREHKKACVLYFPAGTYRGPLRRAGQPAPGQVSVFCGATGTSDRPYTVEKGGRLVVRTVYHEISGDAPQALELNDAGTLIIDSTRFSYKTGEDRPLVGLDGFRGDFALATGLLLPVNSKYPASIRIRGRGDDCNALCLATLFWGPDGMVKTADAWKDESRPAARAALLECNVNGQVKGAKDSAFDKSGFGRLEDRKCKDDEALIRKTLAPLREARIWLPGEAKEGATDLRLHRVVVGAGKGGRCVVLQAGASTKR